VTERATIASVVIGRNEGERLDRCLASLRGQVGRIVYVDSGSTDGSVARARATGVEIVELSLDLPFTAARARNAGLAELRARHPQPAMVQFVDGDCELRPGWLDTACDFLAANPRAAVACGRRRERTPEKSVYNRLCDREWETPIGRIRACGGDALMRLSALDEVGGYDPRLIAGEEPEMCVRLRANGWEIWRLDAEMTLHDAAMTHFSQWWKRTRRGGYAAAEGMAMHGAAPERHGVATVRRALAWGFGLPLVTMGLLAAVGPAGLLLLLAYPAQVLHLALRNGGGRGAWETSFFLTLGKFPETAGIADFALRRLLRRPARLIEYR
jgi:GT2 family glycosyltransferase